MAMRSYEIIVVCAAVALALVLALWGASLFIRAVASRADRVARHAARIGLRPAGLGSGLRRHGARTPAPSTAPATAPAAPPAPSLSTLQFLFGIIVGPPMTLLGSVILVGVVASFLHYGIDDITSGRADWKPVLPLLLLPFAAGALIVGLRWDRSKGRRRCPKCWYDYTGLADAAHCPECGNTPPAIVPARYFNRTRRNRALVVLSPIIVIACVMGTVTILASGGTWRGVFPTWLLIYTFERAPQTLILNPAARFSNDDGSLYSRLENGDLSPLQYAVLNERAWSVLGTTDSVETASMALMLATRTQGFTNTDADTPSNDAALARAITLVLDDAKANGGTLQPSTASIFMQVRVPDDFVTAGAVVRDRAAEVSTALVVGAGTPLATWALSGALAAHAQPSDAISADFITIITTPVQRGHLRDVNAVNLGIILCRDDAYADAFLAATQDARGFTIAGPFKRSVALPPGPDFDPAAADALALRAAGIVRATVLSIRGGALTTPEGQDPNAPGQSASVQYAAVDAMMDHPDFTLARGALVVRTTLPFALKGNRGMDPTDTTSVDRVIAAALRRPELGREALQQAASMYMTPESLKPLVVSQLLTGDPTEAAPAVEVIEIMMGGFGYSVRWDPAQVLEPLRTLAQSTAVVEPFRGKVQSLLKKVETRVAATATTIETTVETATEDAANQVGEPVTPEVVGE
jgi:hypothetical protein